MPVHPVFVASRMQAEQETASPLNVRLLLFAHAMWDLQ